MQQTLRIMPEAIPEVPRDSNYKQFQGVEESRSGQFDNVYRQELDRGPNDAGRSGKDKAAIIDQARTGNKETAHAQQTAKDGNSEKIDAPSDVDDAKQVNHTAASNDKPQVLGTAKISPAKLEQLTDAPEREQIDGKLEQLLLLLEQSDNVLRSPKGQGIAIGEPNGPSGDALIKHNKLAQAIESALSGGKGEKFDLEALVKSFSSDKEGEGLSLDSEAGKLVAKELKQLLLAEDGKALKSLNLDSVQRDGIMRELKALLSQDEGKLDGNINRTPDINGSKDKADVPLQTKIDIGKVIKQASDANQTPPIKGDMSQGQTPGINDKQIDKQNPITPGMLAQLKEEGKLVSAGIKPDAKTDVKPDAKTDAKGDAKIDNSASTAEQDKLVKLDMSGSDGGKTSGKFEQNPNQTPDIRPQTTPVTDEELAYQSKPVEVPGKTNPFAFDASKPLTAAQMQQQQVQQMHQEQQVQTMPMEKADSTVAAMIGSGEKRDGKNILGTANDKSKINTATTVNAEIKVGESGQMAIDESKLAELGKQEMSEHGQFNELRQIIEDKSSRFMPGDLAMGLNPKPGVTSPGIGNNLASDSLASLNAMTQTGDKLNAKMPPGLTDPINIARPEFGTNMRERLVVMMNKGVQSADIRLDPAELGQMQVKMTVENDVTTVNFVVQNSQAKEILEQAMPKLKEMLAEQGIDLGEGSVQQEDKEDKQWQSSQNNGGGQNNGGDDESSQDVEPLVAQQVKLAGGVLGGIDFFA